MKRIMTIALILLVAVSCKKKIKAPGNTREFQIESSYASATYDIKIALPENYDPQNKKYATIYLLDGKDNFKFVAHHCKEISEKKSTENVMVVSIGYGRDRALDYTPTKVKSGSGGAPEFMQFLMNELKPLLESEYAADTTRRSRVILGHSFGGLFGAFAFTKHNNFFGNYLMLSPSLWWDNEVLLQYEQDDRSIISNKDQLVFLGIGKLENSGRMQAPFEAFYQRMSKYYSSMKLEKNSVAGMEHMGSKNPNIIKALEFYFQNR